MTKRKLTPEGQIKRIKDRVGGFVPREPIPPRRQAGWRQQVYIQTATHGVFYTPDFVDNIGFPDGVPTWTAINVGLNLAFEGIGFRGDPFDPENRQYSLMVDALYRRENGGNWVSILTIAQAVAITGGDVNPTWNGFGVNGLNCNINREGWVGVLFWVTNLAHSQNKVVMLYSTDYGATWNESVIRPWGINVSHIPFSLAVGAYKGSSPYDAGDVMYCGITADTFLWVTTNGGLTWSVGAQIGLATYTCHILVDPSDQSRVFVGMRDGVGLWHMAVSLDHGATINDYDLNGSEPMGYGGVHTYYHLSVAMDERKTVRVGAAAGRQHIHTTTDDGGSWEEPTPQYSSTALGISLIQDSPNFLYLLRQYGGNTGNPPSSCHVVFASEDEGRTMILKAGANACTIDTGGGDSIPYNCGGVRGILEVWTDLAEGEIVGYPTYHALGQHPGGLAWPQIEDMVGSGTEEVAAGAHAGQHENGGADEVNVAGLSGVLADAQNARWLRGRVIGAAAPAEGEVYIWRAGPGEWQPGQPLPGSHDLLSAYHGDTLAAVVSRGSLIVGNATPAWAELVVGAAAGDVLLSDTVDASWGQLRSITVNDAAPGLTITQAGAGASLSLPSATTAAKGLILGGDVALYRSAANYLRTPDGLIVDSNVGIGGTPNLMGLGANARVLTIRSQAADEHAAIELITPDLTGANIGGQVRWANLDGGAAEVAVAAIAAARDGADDALGLGFWTEATGAAVSQKAWLSGVGQLSLSVQGIAGGLLIGGDAHIYRLAANELLTPDAFVVDGRLRYGTATEVTIDGAGAITISKSYHRVDTFGNAASDNLDTINGGADGAVLWLQCEHVARDVVVRHNVGNIRLDGMANFTLTGRFDKVQLFYDSVLDEWCGFGLNLV